MTRPHLLDVASSRRAREAQRAQEIEAANRYSDRRGRKVLVHCILLAFLGVPFYAWSWHVTDPERARVWSALGFAVSYAAPFFRWLVYHVRTSETFG